MSNFDISSEEIEKLYLKLFNEAAAVGYHLNPDTAFTKDLVKALLINEKRYGYWACPCRLALGIKDKDLDIICPCDYRDPDLNEYGQCYCALYVSEDIAKGLKPSFSIPERRGVIPPLAGQVKPSPTAELKTAPFELPMPVWRCKVCGYLCAREAPPEVCPICKVKKERFERFI
jgi:ferredoxin-thioredoxin reductase catalytic subunit